MKDIETRVIKLTVNIVSILFCAPTLFHSVPSFSLFSYFYVQLDYYAEAIVIVVARLLNDASLNAIIN